MTQKSKCNYVLDTSTILSSPYSLFAFDEHDLYLADITLDVLSQKAAAPGGNRNASEALRLLSDLSKKGNLWEGIRLDNGGTLRVFDTSQLRADKDGKAASDLVIMACKSLTGGAILVSQDPVQRIKADKVAVLAEEFKTELSNVYLGRREALIPDSCMEEFFANKKLDPNQAGIKNPVVNEFFTLHNYSSPNSSALARYDGKMLVPLRYKDSHPYGITARNAGQLFALEALMAPAEEAPLVILKGPAGTAKTFLSLAVGLDKTFQGDEKQFRRVLAVRPNETMDKEIGFLPGDEVGKIEPLFRPIFDNLETLTHISKVSKDGVEIDNYAHDLISRGIVSLQALGYMRGRSITNTYMIFDEMQNSTPVQAFGLVSRAGEGSKIIICGDPEQIDNPFLDPRTNGLSYTADRMKGSPLCWTVTFTEGECLRSKLAQEAIRRMAPKGKS